MSVFKFQRYIIGDKLIFERGEEYPSYVIGCFLIGGKNYYIILSDNYYSTIKEVDTVSPHIYKLSDVFCIISEEDLYSKVINVYRKTQYNNQIFCDYCEQGTLIKESGNCENCPLNKYVYNPNFFYLQDKVLISPLSKPIPVTGSLFNYKSPIDHMNNIGFCYLFDAELIGNVHRFINDKPMLETRTGIDIHKLKRGIARLGESNFDYRKDVCYYFDHSHFNVANLEKVKLEKRYGFTINPFAKSRCECCILSGDYCTRCKRKTSVWVDIPVKP